MECNGSNLVSTHWALHGAACGASGRAGVLELPEGREQACAVCLHLISFFAEPKLDRVPARKTNVRMNESGE